MDKVSSWIVEKEEMEDVGGAGTGFDGCAGGWRRRRMGSKRVGKRSQEAESKE
jgi:hypothetical protein